MRNLPANCAIFVNVKFSRRCNPKNKNRPGGANRRAGIFVRRTGIAPPLNRETGRESTEPHPAKSARQRFFQGKISARGRRTRRRPRLEFQQPQALSCAPRVFRPSAEPHRRCDPVRGDLDLVQDNAEGISEQGIGSGQITRSTDGYDFAFIPRKECEWTP